jgi:ribosomal protein S27AE
MRRNQLTTRWFLFGISLSVVFSAATFAQSKLGFDLKDASVPSEEIVAGGADKDGIPSIDFPKYVSAKEARFLRGRERVLGITLNGVNRAYPIKILNYHEIVNDVIGDTPITVTYCPLCGSGIAFFADHDDQRLIFGVAGLLYNNDVLLYDRQSESLWSQLMGEAITGPMLGDRLIRLPIAHTTWRDWRERHPDSQVLSTDTGFRWDYDIDHYPDYARSGRVFFPLSAQSREYRRKEMVLGLEVEGQFKAYPFKELQRSPAHISDQFASRQFEIQYDHRNRTARVIDERGAEVATVLTFWFAWYAFHPDTAIFKADD